MAAEYWTSDVLRWWQELEAAGKHRLLATEAYWLKRRRWDGNGMKVNTEELEHWMREYMQRRIASRLMEEGIIL